jgi:hypothetical protein
MDKNYRALLSEAQFTKEILATGAYRIRKANYACKGIYFEAFTCLSTGLERMAKLCVILSHYIDNDGNFPDEQVVKKFSHNLMMLYRESIDILNRYGITLKYGDPIKKEIGNRILKVLSSFAQGDRYANISCLARDSGSKNPAGVWCDTVDAYIYDHCVRKAAKIRIQQNAHLAASVMDSFADMYHCLETGELITDVRGASLMTGLQKAVACRFSN